MKKVTSTLTALILCLYMNAQVGALDPTFNPAPSGTPGYVINNVLPAGTDYGQAIATHSDGRVIVAAYTTDVNFTLLRYTAGGILDNSFGTSGVVNLRQDPLNTAVPFAINVLSDNTILVAGWSWGGTNRDFALLKLKENGTPDSTFGTNGWTVTHVGSGENHARAMAVQSDGKIVLAGFAHNGTDNDFALVRYNADGSLDASGFGTGGIVTTPISGNDQASGVVIQNDGKIVAGGTSNIGTDGNFMAVRYNSDGTLDMTGYGTGGIATIDIANGGAGSNDGCNAIAIQPDGKVVMTGDSRPVSVANTDIATIRLTTAGVPDASFNGDGNNDGIIIYDQASGTLNSGEDGRSIALQSDGKIIIGGDTEPISADFRLLLLRYNSNGSLDSATFDGDGVVTADLTADEELGYAVKLHGNRILVAGSIGASSDLLLAAFENDGTPLPLVLSNFYAQKLSSKVVLQWQTSSEENVKQFVIERSNDGKTYKAIGQVTATGNSNTIKNYTFADQSPFMPANNYYRLLMQDVDGNYKYSKTLIIKFDGELSTNLQVFPNPVKDLLQVQIPNGFNGTIGLQIIDINGRVIRQNHLASDGNALNTTIDVSNLVRGVYILKVQAGNTKVISRFAKQ